MMTVYKRVAAHHIAHTRTHTHTHHTRARGLFTEARRRRHLGPARTATGRNYPTPIRFGANRIAELPDACRELGMKSPLLVTDAGLVSLDMVGEAAELWPVIVQTPGNRGPLPRRCNTFHSSRNDSTARAHGTIGVAQRAAPPPHPVVAPAARRAACRAESSAKSRPTLWRRTSRRACRPASAVLSLSI